MQQGEHTVTALAEPKMAESEERHVGNISLELDLERSKSRVRGSRAARSVKSKKASNKLKRKPKRSRDAPHHKEIPILPCRSSQWHRCEPLWDYFTVELIHYKSMQFMTDDLLGTAALSCGFPDHRPKKTISGRLLPILEDMQEGVSWDEMPVKTREKKLAECQDTLEADNLDKISLKAWVLLKDITEMLYALSVPAAGRGRKESDASALSTTVVPSESDYEDMTRAFLRNFFLQIKSKRVYNAHLYSTDINVKSETVSSDPDMVCGSLIHTPGHNVQPGARTYASGHISLVVEVKREESTEKPKNPKGAALQGCWGTINQHFSQLLICSRDSLFSRNWGKYRLKYERKIPESDIVYTFGLMVHKTKLHVSCLEVSSVHLSKIQKRKPKVRIAIPGRKTTPCAPSDESASKPCAKKRKTSASSEERSRSHSPLKEEERHGKLYISPPVELNNIFNAHPHTRRVFELVTFLETLQYYAYCDNDTT